MRDKRPNNKFYLSEMVDLNGNYVRIEESPSGNTKNGVADGASITDRSGITARPEGLSEGGKPSATKAEPTPLFGNIISQAVQNVNPATIQQQLGNLTNPLADPEVQRQLLAFTDRASLTDGQRLALDVFKRRMGEITPLQAQLQEQQSILARKQANGVHPVDQNDTKNRIALLKTMLAREHNELLSMQSAPGLQQILEKINAEQSSNEQSEMHNALEISETENIISSGETHGAYNSKNDADGKKRNAHAESYYQTMRNRKKSYVVSTIARNSGVDQALVSKMYDHLFANRYNLKKGYTNFDADYYIAESIQRLQAGKNILEHDIILIKHEAMEYDLMNSQGMNYEEAHAIVNKSYNYASALDKWLDENEGW